MRALIVVRTARERTYQAAIKKVADLGATFAVVNDVAPFTKACETMFRIGSRCPSDDVLIAVDGDVIVSKNLLKYVENEWDDRLARLDCRTRDRFRGDLCAGVHVYNNRYSAELTDLFAKAKETRRPESDLVLRFIRHNQLEKAVLRRPVGIHDYGQWLRDVYRKGITRASRANNEQFADINRKVDDRLVREGLLPELVTYRVGLADGRADRRSYTDFRDFPDFNSDLAEPPPLSAEEETELRRMADDL